MSAHYLDSSKNEFIAIPKAEYYVLSNDSFMSGWGGASGKINTCVVPCETYEEAEAVADYARSRSDQKRIRIVVGVRDKAHVVYSMCIGWKDRAKERMAAR